MKIKAFKNYGVLSNEKVPIYTVGAPDSTATTYDEIRIEIPELFVVSENVAGEILIVTPDGVTYLAGKILNQKDGIPALIWYDGEYHCIRCDYQEGWS